MIKELDTVVLKHDIAKYELAEGDIGAVVHCYPDGDAYEEIIGTHPNFLKGKALKEICPSQIIKLKQPCLEPL